MSIEKVPEMLKKGIPIRVEVDMQTWKKGQDTRINWKCLGKGTGRGKGAFPRVRREKRSRREKTTSPRVSPSICGGEKKREGGGAKVGFGNWTTC